MSSGICDHLRERILALERHGISGLWMNVDAYDNFNAGTILGYRGDVWETIVEYSGLWKADGKLQNEQIWQAKLPGIAVNRRNSYKSSLQRSHVELEIVYCPDDLIPVSAIS